MIFVFFLIELKTRATTREMRFMQQFSQLCNVKMFFYFLSEKNFGVQTKILTVDFNDTECYGKLEKELEGLEVGILGRYYFAI